MARWIEFEAAAPEIASRAKELFLANKHLTIATLRRDGSPRISGIEAMFIEGDLWFGSMPRAVKALDLQRDPRYALHCGTGDSSQWEKNPGGWQGDAKLSGRVEELEPGERRAAVFAAAGYPDGGESHLFRADIDEVVTVRLGGNPPSHMIIDSWHEGQEPKQIKR
jgi:hypothetical protein